MRKIVRVLAGLTGAIMIGAVLGACSGAMDPSSLGAQAGDAQATGLPGDAAYTGEVQSIDNASWTVEGLSFAVNGETDIKSEISVGDQATVHLTLDSGGTLVATEIDLADGGNQGTLTDDSLDTPEPTETPSDSTEFTGIVSSMLADSWTIDGKLILINGDTEIQGGIALGDTVKVEAKVAPDGSLTATEIKLATDSSGFSSDGGSGDMNGSESKITGVVEAYSSSSLTVNGQIINLTSDTEIEGTITVGVTVEVEAIQEADGSLIATQVEVKSETSDQNQSDTEIETDSSGPHDGGNSESSSGSDHEDNHGSSGQSDD
jgi:hypothetical protein